MMLTCQSLFTLIGEREENPSKARTHKRELSDFRKIKRNSNVWFYNISILNIVLFFLCKWFKPSAHCNVIILDIYIPKRKLSLEALFLWAINHANSTIKLSDSPLFTCKKQNACRVSYLLMPPIPNNRKCEGRIFTFGTITRRHFPDFVDYQSFSKIKMLHYI